MYYVSEIIAFLTVSKKDTKEGKRDVYIVYIAT